MVIKIDELKSEGLTVLQYLTLYVLYNAYNKNDMEFVYNFGQIPSILLDWAVKERYIRLVPEEEKKEKGNYELRDKIRDLFEGNKDLFLEFLSRFPIKTPSGRYLGTKDENTVKGKELRKKWKKLFKDDAMKMKKALKVLDAEMEWRRKTGKFEFMHNALTWLNQGDYENYEHLLIDKVKTKNKTRSNYE
jgi:hypothetical protein